MSRSRNLPREGQDVKCDPPGDGAVVVGPGLQHRLLEYARTSLPLEACGLLLGRSGRVEDVAQLGNRSPWPREHYALDPLEYMQAERHCDQLGLSVLGVWHSHPDSAALPSVTDERHAWPGWLYVIVGRPRDDVPDLRGWRLDNGRFRQVMLHFGVSEDTAPGSL